MPSGRKSGPATPTLGHGLSQSHNNGHTPQQPQLKFCADCSRHLPPEQSVLHDETMLVDGGVTTITLCARCRQRRLALDEATTSHGFVMHNHLDLSVSPQLSLETGMRIPGESLVDSECLSEDSQSEISEHSQGQSSRVVAAPANYASRISSTAASTSTSSSPTLPTTQLANTSQRHQAQHPATQAPPSPTSSYSHAPDPFIDITHLRVRQRGRNCLYSGAAFRGVQKSGRNSYDVTVTILDVDFPTSFLCGYLTIRGLTEDYPELTTYFDAEIIGPHFGFLTRGWGATEQEDMTHWNRFSAFHSRNVQNAVRGPLMNMDDDKGERGVVFMRWKERFLVPDHRVKDINGASFAGFYYVCVEFEPKERLPLSHADDDEYREVTASMSGYYFHQNSEPYQQLSLHHEPVASSGSFEFR